MLSGRDTDATRAKLALQIYLERIALLRPLAQIANLEERSDAEHLRYWFAEEFVNDAGN